MTEVNFRNVYEERKSIIISPLLDLPNNKYLSVRMLHGNPFSPKGT
jgi:hypothetical protein